MVALLFRNLIKLTTSGLFLVQLRTKASGLFFVQSLNAAAILPSLFGGVKLRFAFACVLRLMSLLRALCPDVIPRLLGINGPLGLSLICGLLLVGAAGLATAWEALRAQQAMIGRM